MKFRTISALLSLFLPPGLACADVLLKDDFSAYGVNSTDLNLNLPAADGSDYPTTLVRQSGSIGTYGYQKQGGTSNSQLGNGATYAGQADAPGNADYLLMAYSSTVSSRLPVDDALVDGKPLTISFDFGTELPPNYTDDSWWAAFRLGDLGNSYPVLGGDAGFAFLYRINKGVQVFTTGSGGVEFPAVTSNHFTMVFTDDLGTGSAFSGNGSKVALYCGTTLLGRFNTGQLSREFLNFGVQNAFASVDNLTIETGVPSFVSDGFRITDTSFDFATGKLDLRWTSEAGKIYKVFHSVGLGDEWEPVSGEIPAQGTSTATTIDFQKTDKDFFRAEEVEPAPLEFDGNQVVQDEVGKTVTMADANGDLQIRLSYAGRSMLDRVQVNGRQVIAPTTGVCTGILADGVWATSRDQAGDQTVTVDGNDVRIDHIEFASGGVSVRESWQFHVGESGIDWEISREYLTGGTLQDTYFPGWDFTSTSAWTGGILDTGGVAWMRYLGSGASYGAHSASTVFWKGDDCLKVSTTPLSGTYQASRFSNQPAGGAFTYAQSVSSSPIATNHNLRRSIQGMDLWAPFEVSPGTVAVKIHLEAPSGAAERYRGNFQGIDGEAVGELMDTIGRYGVIDRQIMGGNGWLTGFVCVHEPFHAEMGIAVADENYTANMATTLDARRDQALQASGRMLPRFCHDTGDYMVPGTYNPQTGFYEVGWGYLLDSQPDYPINVAEEFDLTGDIEWLRSHKESCELSLKWIMDRDQDGDGLVEMMTDSQEEGKSSDWIDIVYASGENALVNAAVYEALVLWTEREEILGDAEQAAAYRAAAEKLKAAYIKPTSEGGFWDPDNGWFVYWRNTDGSIHGNNLVTPVNFCAVAYGLCTDEQRSQLLDTIETKTRAENLFHWPLCFLPYEQGEGRDNVFPTYENGDIFLSWGGMAMRAYASYDPQIAVAYVNRVLARYQEDGLSYQRYLRNSQAGAGDDILAGNCMTIVGLYRNIYGVRPQWDRMMLDPHLTPELAGTNLSYPLRGQTYELTLGEQISTIAVDGFAATGATPFAVNAKADQVAWYHGNQDVAALVIDRDGSDSVELEIQQWPTGEAGLRSWTERHSAAESTATQHTLRGLMPNTAYLLKIDGGESTTLQSSEDGELEFELSPNSAAARQIELQEAP
ncbi:hypothetical protein JIN85_00190 [Luteolibacter pohnpeiensis]|uniref:Alpha-L-rhamnosidase six-hairpin glycosidase domain-containing protein n=1 Tax=Luteolibacter pohnpeiensis TaxID=454153 RepID=A0A934VUJ5_9BACT|nr:hypothetical protein [Luteolibacter pohnpeiensis]MBK1880808.1 hypothetical protein [Luteolibacter pohnpeiensis]